MPAGITVKRVVWTLLILSGAAVILYAMMTDRLDAVWQAIVNEETHIALFIGLFLVLPLFGFPISVFLLLIGVKFPIISGLAIMFGGMAVHLALSYPAANTLLRPMLERTLSKTRYRLPQFSKSGFVGPGIVFMSMPGLSYTMKNYIFSLSGIPFRYYFSIGLLSQAVLGVPVVIAGDLVRRQHLWIVVIFLVAAAAGYLLFHLIRKQCKESES